MPTSSTNLRGMQGAGHATKDNLHDYAEDEELELLGVPRKRDKDAIPLNLPSNPTRTARMTLTALSGGPRPRNTLNTSNAGHSSRLRGPFKHPFASGQLPSNSNINRRDVAMNPTDRVANASTDMMEHHRPKRRRVQDEVASAEDLRGSRMPADRSGAQSRKSVFCVPEYQAVESRMRSTPGRIRISNASLGKEKKLEATLSLGKASCDTSVAEDEIFVIGSKPRQKQKSVLVDHNLSASLAQERGKHLRGTSSYRNGCHGDDITSSPDELLSETTMKTRRRTAQGSPTKPRQLDVIEPGVTYQKGPLHFIDSRDDLHSSIRPVEQRHQPAKDARGQAELCTVPLSAISDPGFPEEIKDPESRLVYNPNDNCLIFATDYETPQFPANQRIDAQKIWKVTYADRGGQLRFWLSKVGNAEYILDFTVQNEQAIGALLDRLSQRNNFRMEKENRGRLATIIERRRQNNRIPRTRSIQEAEVSERADVVATPNHLTQSGPDLIINEFPQNEIIRNLKRKVSGEDHKQGGVESEVLQRDSNEAGGKPEKKDFSSAISRIMSGHKPEPLKHNAHIGPRRSLRLSRGSPENRRWEHDQSNDIQISQVKDLGQPWREPLTYPKAGKRKTTIEFTDLERLDEGEFLNDGIVAFYIRYLEEQVRAKDPRLLENVHFFSTFFYERLVQHQGGAKGINYSAVQNWTRNIDIFNFEFVVVPINEAAHWYLAIICNLPGLFNKNPAPWLLSSRPGTPNSASETAQENETRKSFAELSLGREEDHLLPIKSKKSGEQSEEAPLEEDSSTRSSPRFQGGSQLMDLVHVSIGEESPRYLPSRGLITRDVVTSPTRNKTNKRTSLLPPTTRLDPESPLIFIFDSLGSPHNLTVRHLKDYIIQECANKKGGLELDVSSIKGLNAKAIPQQHNFSDCGLYMLGYLEKFLEDPKDFVTKIIRREYQEEDWIKLQPRKMRHAIRTELLMLGKQQDDEISAAKAQKRLRKQAEIDSSPLSASSVPGKLTDEKPAENVATSHTHGDTRGKESSGQNSGTDSPTTLPVRPIGDRYRLSNEITKYSDEFESESAQHRGGVFSSQPRAESDLSVVESPQFEAGQESEEEDVSNSSSSLITGRRPTSPNKDSRSAIIDARTDSYAREGFNDENSLFYKSKKTLPRVDEYLPIDVGRDQPRTSKRLNDSLRGKEGLLDKSRSDLSLKAVRERQANEGKVGVIDLDDQWRG